MKQCWAYNTQGQRCEQDPGHDGDHTIAITWTDADCYDPSSVPPAPTPPPPPIPVSNTEWKELRCVACSHKHRGSECHCGCKEFIG